MQAIYAARRERLRRAMRARGLDALLVSQAANRFYLSGFELHDPQCNESAGRLIVTADGRDWLATDARYLDAAARLWDQERIFIYGGDAAKDLHSLLRRCGGRVGLEARGVSLAFARALDQAGAGPRFEAADGLVEHLRRIKEPCEIAALERSFALNHKLLQWVEGQLEPGRTEKELSWAIERFFRENGAGELAFANIVAVGRNAALPHAIPGEDAVTENCPVLIDVGCRVDAYCSAQTRPLRPRAACPCAKSMPWPARSLKRPGSRRLSPTAWATAWAWKPTKPPACPRAPKGCWSRAWWSRWNRACITPPGAACAGNTPFWWRKAACGFCDACRHVMTRRWGSAPESFGAKEPAWRRFFWWEPARRAKQR